MDDDILLEPLCFARLWSALESGPHLGGVNAMITNQRYQTPGRIIRFVFRLMAGRAERSYAGRVLGPAVNLLPEDGDDLPKKVPVEWLNTTCTLYRREALPDPPFPDHFTGYSLMEDLTLSLTVGKRWKLVNARTARASRWPLDDSHFCHCTAGKSDCRAEVPSSETVIEDSDFDTRIALGKCRLNRLGQNAGAVVRHDAHQHDRFAIRRLEKSYRSG